MPKDYSLAVTPVNEQRRPKNAMSDEWVKDFLRRARIGHVATRWDDQPFITPTSFWYDEVQQAIVFHSNIVGRVRANNERHEQVCFEASEYGEFLPSNVALEFTVQYQSVMVFGKVRVIEGDEEKRRALYGLIDKYYPTMTAGKEYRPITDQELKRTSVYVIATLAPLPLRCAAGTSCVEQCGSRVGAASATGRTRPCRATSGRS